MGHQLARPVTTKVDQECGSGEEFRWAISSMQGYRAALEDKHLVQKPFTPSHPKWTLFALFDGHGGSRTVNEARKLMVPTMLENGQVQQALEATIATGGVIPSGEVAELLAEGLREAVKQTEKKLLAWAQATSDQAMEAVEAAKAAEEQRKKDSSSSDSEIEIQQRETYKRRKEIEQLEWRAESVFREGTTFVGVLITPQHYIFINCGDSRAFLSRLQPTNSRKRKQSGDHSLNGRDKEKIEHYTRDHTSCSRCLGDFHMEKSRPCLPETIIVERDTQLDEFLVLACDGIFDIFKNEQLRDLIRARAAGNVDLLEAVNQVLDIGLAVEHRKGEWDNMTLAVIAFGEALLCVEETAEEEAKWLKEVEKAFLEGYMKKFDCESPESYEEMFRKTDFEHLRYDVESRYCYEAHPGIKLVPDAEHMMKWLVEERKFPPLPSAQGGHDLAQVVISKILEPKVDHFLRAFLADKEKYGNKRDF